METATEAVSAAGSQTEQAPARPDVREPSPARGGTGQAAPARGGTGQAAPARAGTGQAARARAHRQRNARGQGARLADDIVAGALVLIERTGSDEAVTLRAVAREIGIAAPSIYAHFADRDAIIMAVVLRVFDELSDAITQGQAASGPDPVDRLVAGCEAYLAFGLEHPARYGVLFVPHGANPEEYCAPVQLGANGGPVLAFGAESFALLVEAIEECATAGASASTDPITDATAVWVALHGTVMLRTALPGFPWPERHAFTRQLVLPLARVGER
jgi:AcrR family transcriptional regulator